MILEMVDYKFLFLLKFLAFSTVICYAVFTVHLSETWSMFCFNIIHSNALVNLQCL